jgi:YrbI family 3-deoxy-D-manno-octulosonate 8-phosphate phosphatase
VILPLVLDSRYTVDIDTLDDWQRAEWLVAQGRSDGQLPMVTPGARHRPLPAQVDLLVLDFDGVLTDNRVWVDQDGREMVAANRSDSIGLNQLRQAGVQIWVLSTETNPVVGARCRKLNLPVYQSIEDKGAALRSLLSERQINPANVVYLGNDVNDLPCFPLVGCAAVVGDAHPEARRRADLTLTQPGGRGAVRELCDLLCARIESLL